LFLDLLATNKWERPIYFNQSSLLSLGVDVTAYAVQEGSIFRILPVRANAGNAQFVNTKIMYENMMQKMYWRGLNNPKVYYNENYREVFINRNRREFNTLAKALINEGKTEKAREVLLKSLDLMPDSAVMYSYTSPETIRLLLTVGEKKKAMEIVNVTGKRAEEFLAYAEKNKLLTYERENYFSLLILNQLSQIMKAKGENELASQYQQTFLKYNN